MTTLADLKTLIDIVEETYELMLGYAAQGLAGDEGNKSGGQLRDFLKKADDALAKLGPEFRSLVASEGLTPADKYSAFIEVIEQDAKAASAGLQLVLAQSAISSQLIDNMNASIHLRALLTDLFLIDEIVKRAIAKS